MADDREELTEIQGNWYGVMVHYPSRGIIHASFQAEGESFAGEWDFPTLSGGAGRHGRFVATRFANWLNIRIKTAPLKDVQFQIAILHEKGQTMLTGVVPLQTEKIPFLTVTLFRYPPPEFEITGVCPLIQLHRK